ncbi:hypothetical protein VTI74DRAFT_9756 [Chaetomium olivicolor]
MLPPVENAVLENNPQFAALYSKLTSSVLNPDGSTKTDRVGKQRNEVREELNKYRLQTAKEHLLSHAISTASPQSIQTKHAPVPSLTNRSRLQQQGPSQIAELPEPLLDLLLLLPPLLTSSDLSPRGTALLLSNPPFSDLPSHLPHLATLVSNALHSCAVDLARIANPSTNPSYVHRSIPSLPNHAATLTSTVADLKAELTRARLSAATKLTSLLQEQTAVLSQLLRTLEAKHGPIARSLEFRATETALAAQRQEAEAETALLLAKRETYTPEAAQALTNYANHLRDAKGRLTETIHTLKAELEAYGVGVDDGTGRGKDKVMREMARVYSDMGRQMEDVRGDLERLRKA